jgi:hypothetical protein
MPFPCGQAHCRACPELLRKGYPPDPGREHLVEGVHNVAPTAIKAEDLLGISNREFILLAGKDGVGKTNCLISLADFVSQMEPDATVFVIDLENKFRPALSTYGTVPPNLRYYQCETMNDVTEAFDEIMSERKPGDWLFVESAGRVWERAQDMGYQAVTGTMKAAYMEKRRATPQGQKQPPVVPKPDDLWSIVKGAHDDAFMERIAAASDLNCIITTGVARVKEMRTNRKENQDRVDFRNETGIDLNIEGAPRLVYYPLTGILLEKTGGSVTGRIWRDNMSKLDEPAIVFDIPTRKDFAMQFYTTTGRV